MKQHAWVWRISYRNETIDTNQVYGNKITKLSK